MKLPPVWIYKIINSFRLKLKRFYYALTPANVAVFEMAQQFWIAKSIGVACELNVAEIIGKETKLVDDIAKEANVDSKSLYRLLRALANEGVFKEEKAKRFSNTKKSASLISSEYSMKYMIQHQLNTDNWAALNELKYSVTTGKSAVRKLFGEGIFEHIGKDTEKNDLYNKAMINTSEITGEAILGAYDFSGIQRLVDVGGGQGRLLAGIMRKYPQMKGVLLDMPHVVEGAESLFENQGISNNLEIMAGSFFDIMPADCDGYILKNILHNFDDEKSVEILKKIRNAISPKGRLIIIEMIIPKFNKSSYAKLFDLQMLLGSDGSKERTEEEYEDVFNKAGFELSRIVDLVSPFSVIEARVAD
jgi:ubiquinone/menaquinone biosynthesis C-methylase UbiE/predicted transcriptional regulator